ncbi:MAG: DUF2800 domain-containing protein, partial [Bacteroidaceae bacterium]|nr:DUF2800 domain-containing protein [Bacteroidaceae bacterium]
MAGECLSIAEKFGGKSEITDDEMAKEVLPSLNLVKQWAASMEEYALGKALNGTHYEGFKLVEGRSIRKVTDPVKLGHLLREKGLVEIYKPLELKGITDLEKLVGKKELAEI